jgi:signal transduction histidine kinase/ActR/RegA family two-component response regulator
LKSRSFSLKNRIINHLIGSSDNAISLVPSQIHQAWFRILFGITGTIYLCLHGPFMEPYKSTFIASASLYFAYNILTLITIRHKPISIFRMLFAPLMDVYVVSLSMIIDGGQSSGLYLIFFIIIFGNAVRFGNTMLMYSQALSVVGMLLVSVSTLYGMQLSLDGTLLLMQTIAILLIPAYALIITRQTERAILEKTAAEEATFGLLDHGPLPVFTYQIGEDDMPRILYANTAMQHVCRDSTTSLIGEQVDILALMEDGDEMITACQQPFSDIGSSEESHRFYVRGRNAHNHLIQLMGQSMRLHWHDRWIGICFLLDITQAEAVRNELGQTMHDNYMGTMVAGIVHDFRNVLTSIIGTAEVMQFSTTDKESKSQLGLIMDAGERGSNMVSHLLAVSKNKQRQSEKSPDPHLLYKSLTSIVGLLRIQLPPNIQLHLEVSKTLPAVSVRIAEIEQMVMNLINNASEAISHSGHIWVTLSSYHGDKLSPKVDSALCITVSDDGKGIPQEHIDDVTKPFWTSRQNEGGTGLGLAMIQRIVQKNNGQMEINSTVGEGTRISIYLPEVDRQIPKPVSEQGPPTEKTADEEFPTRPWNLLLVDDIPDVLAVHQAQLERMGHHVITADNGEAALQLFKQQSDRIDLLVTDFKMPKMDGVDLSLAIHEMRVEIPILIITAYADIEKLQQLSDLNIYILSKPSTYRKLNNTIATIQNENQRVSE